MRKHSVQSSVLEKKKGRKRKEKKKKKEERRKRKARKIKRTRYIIRDGIKMGMSSIVNNDGNGSLRGNYMCRRLNSFKNKLISHCFLPLPLTHCPLPVA